MVTLGSCVRPTRAATHAPIVLAVAFVASPHHDSHQSQSWEEKEGNGESMLACERGRKTREHACLGEATAELMCWRGTPAQRRGAHGMRNER